MIPRLPNGKVDWLILEGDVMIVAMAVFGVWCFFMAITGQH